MGSVLRHRLCEAIISLRSPQLHSGMYVVRLGFTHKLCHVEVTTSAGMLMF